MGINPSKNSSTPPPSLSLTRSKSAVNNQGNTHDTSQKGSKDSNEDLSHRDISSSFSSPLLSLKTITSSSLSRRNSTNSSDHQEATSLLSRCQSSNSNNDVFSGNGEILISMKSLNSQLSSSVSSLTRINTQEDNVQEGPKTPYSSSIPSSYQNAESTSNKKGRKCKEKKNHTFKASNEGSRTKKSTTDKNIQKKTQRSTWCYYALGFLTILSGIVLFFLLRRGTSTYSITETNSGIREQLSLSPSSIITPINNARTPPTSSTTPKKKSKKKEKQAPQGINGQIADKARDAGNKLTEIQTLLQKLIAKLNLLSQLTSNSASTSTTFVPLTSTINTLLPTDNDATSPITSSTEPSASNASTSEGARPKTQSKPKKELSKNEKLRIHSVKIEQLKEQITNETNLGKKLKLELRLDIANLMFQNSLARPPMPTFSPTPTTRISYEEKIEEYRKQISQLQIQAIQEQDPTKAQELLMRARELEKVFIKRFLKTSGRNVPSRETGTDVQTHQKSGKGGKKSHNPLQDNGQQKPKQKKTKADKLSRDVQKRRQKAQQEAQQEAQQTASDKIAASKKLRRLKKQLKAETNLRKKGMLTLQIQLQERLINSAITRLKALLSKIAKYSLSGDIANQNQGRPQ